MHERGRACLMAWRLMVRDTCRDMAESIESTMSTIPTMPLTQEDMYSYVTIADDQSTKGKGTVVVQDA